MKDALHEIVQHTHGLGFFSLIKVMGTDSYTKLNGVAEDNLAILDAKFHNPMPEFIGTFGMPNLQKLNTILNIPEYRENAQLSITTKTENGDTYPSGIDFVNKDGDFKNNYRFMSGPVADEKLKTVKFRGVTQWDIEVVPPVTSIQRLKFQRQVHSEDATFMAVTNGDKLEFHFGDKSSHAGNFVFCTGIRAKLTHQRVWPVSVFDSILSLPGDKVVRFSDQGAAQIEVDSGLALYSYTIVCLTK
jgi:hypothetical protein